MFNSTNNFRSLVGNSGRVVKTKISYSDIDVTSEDVLQYFKFTDEIIDEKNSNYIGSFTGKKVVYTLMGDVPGYTFSSSDRWITVYQGILVNSVYEYIPQGKFKVIKAPQDKKTYDIEVEALDSSVLFDIKYSLPQAVWPMTVMQWTQAICAEVGVYLGSISWFNSELMLETEPYVEGTFRDAIKIIAQAGATFAKIGRDVKLYFKNFSVVSNLIENVFEYKVDEMFGPVNSLLLTRDPTNDNVGIVDQASIDSNGETQISIDNNPILDTDRETLISGLFNVVNGFSYQVAEVEYPGDPCIDVGDIITFKDDQDAVISLYVLFSEIEDSGSWYGTIKAVAMSKTDADSDYVGSYDKRLHVTEINVDKVKQEIVLVVSSVESVGQDASDALSTANTAQARADLAVTNATTAQSAANAAQGTANTANTAASTANGLLVDLASDSKLTAVEKQQIKIEWDAIVSEKVINDTQATAFSITTEKTNYGTSYSALSTYIIPLLASLTATSDIVGTTFRATFKDYYDKRQLLLNAIASKGKTLADAAQTTANTAVTNASTAQTQADQGVADASAAQSSANAANASAAGLSTRVQAAEEKITPQAITHAVEDTSTVLAKKSYVDQTAGAFALAIGETIRDEYGNTISNIQGNFIFTSGGMEIKMTGAEFSTFYTANKIEFRQNGNVLQWLSGNKNYMTDLIVVGNLSLNYHKFESLPNKHTVFRYIGG